MAFTVNRVKKTVMGDMRMVVLSCTADTTTGSIETGLDRVYGFSVGPISMSTSSYAIYPNALAGGTAAAGYVAVTGFTAADEFQLICFGT
jgi:hypothetical protein